MPRRRINPDRLVRGMQRLRVPMLVLICLLGTVASAFMAHKTYRQQQQVLRLTFADDAEDDLAAITQSIESSLEQVRTLGTFIRSAKRVDRQTFAAFVLPALRRHPSIQGFAWVPRIAHEQRAEFEQAASITLDRPFTIWSPASGSTSGGASGGTSGGGEGDDGRLERGENRYYYPVTFAEPAGQLASLVGFDLGGDPVRLETLRRAAESGRLAVTPPVHLGTDDAGGRGAMAFMPIYRGGAQPATPQERLDALLGFAAAGFLYEDVVAGLLRSWAQPGLQIYLFDPSLPQGSQLLYSRYDTPPAGLTAEAVLTRSRLRATETLDAGGRPWLLVAVPTGGYVATARSADPLIVLGVGLLLTLLVGVILAGMIRSSDLMARFAASREAANAELRQRIAEREEAEQALAQANEELRAINADMERFVGAVSHDLKSPLVAAEMLIAVMRQALAKQDTIKVAETATQIGKACGRMRRIIDDLLEHQRVGWSDMKTQPVDLLEVALRVVEEHREEINAAGAHVHLDDDLPTLRADRGRLTAALDNLFSNALKYGVQGDSPTIMIGWDTTDSEVRLFVQDNGPGIPEEHRDRLWELFQRLARDEEGTGIGLAIVQRVAEAHGGRAWVECPPPPEAPPEGPPEGSPEEMGGGGGSIFYIALPKDRLVKTEAKTTEAAAA